MRWQCVILYSCSEALRESGYDSEEDFAEEVIADTVGQLLYDGDMTRKIDETDIPDEVMPEPLRKAIAKIAKTMGVKVQYLNTDDFGANGFVQGGVIYLSVSPEKAVPFVFGHEMTHKVREMSEDTYQNLKTLARSLVNPWEWHGRMAMVSHVYRDEAGYDTDDSFEEEVVADILGDTINDTNMLDRLATGLAEGKKTKSEKFMNRILGAVKAVKEFFNGVDYYEQRIDNIAKRIEQAYREARESNRNSDSTNRHAKMSVKLTKDLISELFEKAQNGEFVGKPVSIGTLSQQGKTFLENLSGLTFKDSIDFVLNPSDLKHIYKDHFGDNEKDKGNNVPLTIDDVRNVLDVFMSPDKVLYGIDRIDNRKVFFFLKEDRDGTLNLAEICSTKKGNLTTKSLYKTRKGIDQRVMEIKNSLLPTSETSSGIPLSDGKVINFINFTQEIAKKYLRHDNIDNIVRQARDSGTYLKAFNGEVSNLTPEQWADVRTDNFKDFFGDWENDPENASQMVDENGEPKVFYHNTDNSFTNSSLKFE